MADGKPPQDAVADRDAQDHEQADIETGGSPRPGLYPADEIDNREGDNTPNAPDPQVEWDERIQRERADEDNIETEGDLIMGKYEPDDSRIVTNVAAEAPGEPPRIGPREDEARAMAKDDGEKNEKRGPPTARDAAGNKQPGYAEKGEAAEEEEPPLGK